jgi:hypothetical protein
MRIPSTGNNPNEKSISARKIEATTREPNAVIIFRNAGFNEKRTHVTSCIATASNCLLSTWS